MSTGPGPPPAPDRLPGPAASITAALAKSVKALALASADYGAVQLARKYAAAIDAEAKQLPVVRCVHCELDTPIDSGPRPDLERLGPKLLAVLVELGATPGSRRAVKGSDVGSRDPAAAAMDAIRAARAARINGPAPVDPAPT